MKSEQTTKEDIKNLVIRPLILKRDGYKCACCGIPHKSEVYINSRKNYIICDPFIKEWAKKEGKKVFTVYLNVINVTGYGFTEDPRDYLSLCPKHSQQYNMDILKDFREKFNKKIQEWKGFKPNNFDFYRVGILDTLIADVKECTGVKITQNQADSIISNLNSNL